MSDFYCPYCKARLDDPDECYEVDATYEQECPRCEKEFVFTISYSVSYYPQQAACLNGAEHREERTRTWPWECSRMRCKTCGRERALTDAERESMLAEAVA